MRTQQLFIGAAALAVIATPMFANAGGFATARFGGEHAHPTTSHASAVYFNPAGLSLSSGTRIVVEGMFVHRSASYNRPVGAIDNIVPDGEATAGTPAAVTSANSGEATLSDVLAAPFLAVVSDLGIKNLGVAAAVYAPFGGSASWDQNSTFAGNDMYPGAVDGVARWASIEGKIQSVYGTIAGSYYFPKLRLAVGAGLNVISTQVKTIRARNASGTDNLVTSDGRLQEGRVMIDVSGTSMSLGAGVIWRPTDALSIGLSYQSRPNFKATNLEGELTTKLSLAEPSVNDVSLRWPLPDIARLGVSYKPNAKTEVRVFGDFTRWSVVDNHCAMITETVDRRCLMDARGNPDSAGATIVFNIPRRWESTVGLRVGGSYWLTEGRELFAGLGYDGNAVPDATMSGDIIDQEKMTASLGARVLVTPKLRITGTFTQVVYFEREQGIRDAPLFDGISSAPDAAGSYNQAVSLLNLAVEYMF